MVADFAPHGAGATQTFAVENTSDEKITIEVETFRRQYDAKGNEKRSETSDFTIYPEAFELGPKEKRNLRLTWVGDPKISEEMAYRLVVSQLPISTNTVKKSDKKVNIRFLVQYVASLYVRPEGAVAQMQFLSVQIQKKSAKDSHLTLQLKNAGKAHQVLTGTRLFVSGKNSKGETQEVELPSSQLKAFDSENLLAGQEKTFQIPLTGTFPDLLNPVARLEIRKQ